MNIVFMGTPDFAVPALEKIIDNFNVQAVFTQPDKERGRGKKVTYSEVKEVAVANNIEVIQPKSLRRDKEAIQRLKDLSPDFMIVVAYGQILSKEVLDIPKYGCINLHGSLLPKYRGSAPIQWSVINGEKVAGNTTMLMDVGIDTGDMLLKQEVEVTENMTSGELYANLKTIGADLLVETIKKYANGEIIPEKQNDEESSHAPMLDKKMGNIDWESNAQTIHNLIRGLNPWPMAYTSYNGITMKIHGSSVKSGEHNKVPGTIIKVTKDGIEVACGKDILVIEKLQFPGKKAMNVVDYLRGNTIEEGIILTRIEE